MYLLFERIGQSSGIQFTHPNAPHGAAPPFDRELCLGTSLPVLFEGTREGEFPLGSQHPVDHIIVVFWLLLCRSGLWFLVSCSQKADRNRERHFRSSLPVRIECQSAVFIPTVATNLLLPAHWHQEDAVPCWPENHRGHRGKGWGGCQGDLGRDENHETTRARAAMQPTLAKLPFEQHCDGHIGFAMHLLQFHGQEGRRCPSAGERPRPQTAGNMDASSWDPEDPATGPWEPHYLSQRCLGSYGCRVWVSLPCPYPSVWQRCRSTCQPSITSVFRLHFKTPYLDTYIYIYIDHYYISAIWLKNCCPSFHTVHGWHNFK